MNELYRGYLISPQYVYNDGKTDFNVFPEEGREEGWLRYRSTLDDIKTEIDEKILELTFENL